MSGKGRLNGREVGKKEAKIGYQALLIKTKLKLDFEREKKTMFTTICAKGHM